MNTASEIVGGALNAQIMSQEIYARNLANVATPGFKRNVAMVEAVSKSRQDTAGMPTVTGAGIDLSQGAIQPTYNNLDFAIQGEGFFTVTGPKGLRYTRSGSFGLNENRVLVTAQGHPVVGDSGEIQIPADVDKLTISRTGEIRGNNAVLGTLKITAFDKPQMLRQAGGSEFIDEGAAPREARTFSVQQGFVEGSNVNPVSELVRMLATLRDYESCSRSLTSIQDSATKLYAWARG